MNSWKDKINSLCLIPELTCPKKCPYCYEKMKKYKEALTWEDYLFFVRQNLETLPSLTEVLIDYNGVESGTNINRLVKIAPQLSTVITCRLITMVQLIPFIPSTVEFHVSLHDQHDVELLKEILPSHLGRIRCFSILLEDALTIKELDGDIYLLHNKFGYHWREKKPSDLLADSLRAGSGLSILLDHCLSTRMNQQDCPATTQINLYRDGSIRRCPYQPEEPENADYSKGCALIGSKI